MIRGIHHVGLHTPNMERMLEFYNKGLGFEIKFDGDWADSAGLDHVLGLDEGSVLDGRMRVRGVEGLRVVDCSAMPGRISGNTNGPAMAFAWRASDLILEDAASGKGA